MELWAVRSDLTLEEEPLLVIGGWVPRNHYLREAPEGEGQTGGGLHLDGDIFGEEDTALECHWTRSKDF